MRRLLQATVTAIFGAVLLIATVSAGPSNNRHIGLVTGTSMDDCDRAVELEVGWVRADFRWNLLEPNTQGTFNWGFLDDFVDCLMNNDIKLFATLAYAPAWAGGAHVSGTDGNENNGIPDMNAWQSFVSAVMTRYNSYGDNIVYGVWNEPNDDKFLYGNIFNPALSTYAELYERADIARDSVRTGAILAGPEVGGEDFYDFFDAIDQDMEGQDVVTTHWYPGFTGATANLANYLSDTSSHAGEDVWLTETGSDEGGYTQAEEIHHILITANGHKPFIYVVWNNDDSTYDLINGDGSKNAGWYMLRSFLEVVELKVFSLKATNNNYVGHNGLPGGLVATSGSVSDEHRFTIQHAGTLDHGDVVTLSINGFAVSMDYWDGSIFTSHSIGAAESDWQIEKISGSGGTGIADGDTIRLWHYDVNNPSYNCCLIPSGLTSGNLVLNYLQ